MQQAPVSQLAPPSPGVGPSHPLPETVHDCGSGDGDSSKPQGGMNHPRDIVTFTATTACPCRGWAAAVMTAARGDKTSGHVGCRSCRCGEKTLTARAIGEGGVCGRSGWQPATGYIHEEWTRVADLRVSCC